jgi:ABC-type transport system substrate-binding protein
MVDEMSIAFTTVEVESLFPYNLPYVLMISKCAMEEVGNDVQVYAQNPAGSGPYRFSSVVPHERLELVPNEDYWNPERIPAHDRLVLLPMPEATTRAAALMSGQVNFIEAPSPDMIPALEASGMTIATNVYPHYWPYVFNTLDGPFADVRVRQAANLAVNRDEVVALLGGYATPAYGAYIPEQANFGEPNLYTHDPERARALLEEAGCMPCEIRVAISTSGSGQMQPLPMNELVQSHLEAAGFSITFEVIDWNTMIDIWNQGAVAFPQYDAINFSSATMDPLQFVKGFMKRFQTPGGGNWGGFEDEEVESLLAQVLETFDTDEQNALIRRAHEIVVDQAARLYVVSDLNPRAMAPNVAGFVQAQSWFQDITPIVVE